MKNKIGVIIQARTGSKRLPNKVLKKINKNQNILEFLINRLKLSKTINKIVLATTNLKEDDRILKINSTKIKFFRGSQNNVLKRYIDAAEKYDLNHIIRITADCPFTDPNLIDKMTKKYINSQFNYISNVNPPSYPNGFDIEIFSLELLKKSLKIFNTKKNMEHVTYSIRDKKSSKKLKVKSYNFSYKQNLNKYRLTLDTIEDLKIIKKVEKKINIKDNWKKIFDQFKKIK